jgi:hypothetical protein
LSNTLGSKINFPFTATMGGLGTGNPQWMTVDANGFVYITGRYDNSMGNVKDTKDFNGNTLLWASPASLGDQWDVYIAKLNGLGKQIWIRTMWGKLNDVWRWDIVVDAKGDVYVKGFYSNDNLNSNGVLDFNGNALLWVSGTTSNDVFVAKLSWANGAQEWIRTMGGTGGDFPIWMNYDSNGNLYVSGNYTNSNADSNFVKDFNGNTLLWVTGTTSADGFVMKISSANGAQEWIKTMGGTGSDNSFWKTNDVKANLYESGNYTNSNADTNYVKDFNGTALLW